MRDYPVEISVGRSASEISYPYVLDGGELELGGLSTAEVFADGGVYDNLGLETAWKRYTSVLVSDGGDNCAPPAPCGVVSPERSR